MPATGEITTLRLTIECEVDGDAKMMAELLADRITGGSESVFFDDYGYDAWGGYEGPFVVACTVRDEGGVILKKHEQRERREEDDE